MRRYVLIGAGVVCLVLLVIGLAMCSKEDESDPGYNYDWTTTYHTTTTTRFDPDGAGWTPGFY